MADRKDYILNLYSSISSVDKEQYNNIIDPQNPFLEYEFLEALEQSGCVGWDTTWKPYYITLKDKQTDNIVGAVTFYMRFDSYGEFIFDWEWARAFYESGMNYYPKMLVAIPFTPTNGIRIQVDKEYSFKTCAGIMVEYLIDICKEKNFSSIHFLFLTKKEQEFLESYGFLSRTTHQYHWKNRDYNTFDDFLADLRAGRRKQIKKERKYLSESDLNVQVYDKDNIEPQHIDAVWQFYMDTSSRKWGSAYLNRKFFDLIYEKMRERLVLVLAKNANGWVGGTFNVVKNESLFGRYWGCMQDYRFLHFECCYYSLIEYAISNNIKIFEAGAQGEHKFLRGFGAYPTYSSHYINNKGASAAISSFLDSEKVYISNLIDRYNSKSPLKYLHVNS
ncbi:MAG: GNAT family N-acetyltransferase [Candidatus Dadabacteria bacterium]|nr:GNAT family N-acetyltransferase [Candidatus Dadabacteria bacterium]NIS08445.1 GNAT family N-acetyltransferase [Candidatus Dadabacteria bacterium]NIV42010.1 GNAT family N-acetyltransferase [Candidatus Dadabacteria bacterium]NIY21933.1 GNAT family N-acetyltransferase [Candidatus Dadabacteria bacterium]